MSEMCASEMSIEEKLRQMISWSNDLTDLYKQALGTIVEQRACIEDWQRRSLEWCKRCEKAGCAGIETDSVTNDLPWINKLRRAAASSPYGYYNVTVEQANALSSEVRQAIGELREELAQTRYHRDKLEAQIEAAKVANEDYARHVARDAFLDGANWLEHWLRDKPLGALLTRRAQDEAAKRWPDGERNG